MWTALNMLNAIHGIELVIEGCAPGADRLAEVWASEAGIPVSHHPADWARFGKSAGARQNEAMLLTRPDLVVAFYADKTAPSPGTRHMVTIARSADIQVVTP